MKRAAVLSILVAVGLLAVAVIAEAQQPAKSPPDRIPNAVSLSVNAARVEAFRQGLRKLGYVEGKTYS